MKTGAIFSDDTVYRYALWRVWDDSLPLVLFVMLNPSTADAELDDPTIRRVVGFAKAWGYGGAVVVNLFGFRATSPKVLKTAADPVGPDNDRYIREFCPPGTPVICAWSQDGSFKNRGNEVYGLIRECGGVPYYLKLTKAEPWHPLYLPASLTPILYERENIA